MNVIKPFSRHIAIVFLPDTALALVTVACSLTSLVSKQLPTAVPPTLAAIPTVQATTMTPLDTQQAPQATSQIPATGGVVDPCKLVTKTEIKSLLGSVPAPDARTNAPGDKACDFMLDTGLLSVNAASNPYAAAEFQMATGQFNQKQGYKSLQSQGVSVAVYGGDNVDGNGTPGFTAFMNKDNLLVQIKLYSKTYTYNPDKAMTLLKSIADRLP